MKVVDDKTTKKDNKKSNNKHYLLAKLDVYKEKNPNKINLASDKNQNKTS